MPYYIKHKDGYFIGPFEAPRAGGWHLAYQFCLKYNIREGYSIVAQSHYGPISEDQIISPETWKRG